MPRIEKEVIRPGEYWYIDQATQTPRKATFGPDAIKYFYDQGKLMRQAGLSIPVPIEHQLPNAPQPLTAAERAVYNTKNNAGWIEDYKLKKIKDEITGQEVEALFSELDIPDTEFAKTLPKTIRWSSPWISSFTDGNGKQWNGVISHLALTTRPRIVKQQPFASLDAAMSLAENLQNQVVSPESLTSLKSGFGLSRAGLLTRKADKPKPVPAYPLAFSLYSGIGFAEDLIPSKEKSTKEKPQEKKEGKKPPEKSAEEPENPENPEELEESIEESLLDEDGDIAIHEVIQDLLEAIGIPMPPSTADNFCENLYKAAMAKVKGDSAATTGEIGTMGQTNNNNTPPTIQEQPPLYMGLSLADALKIADPKERNIALSFLSLRDESAKQAKRSEVLEKNAVDSAREFRKARVNRLLQKMAPANQQKLLALAGFSLDDKGVLQVKPECAGFSLDDQGKVADALDAYLGLLEASTPDLPELLTATPLSIQLQPHPQEPTDKMSEERRQAVVAEICKNGGIRAPAKAS